MSTGYAVPVVWQDETTLTAEQLNANFTALVDAANQLQTDINNLSVGTSLPSVFVASAAAYGMSPNATPTANAAALQAAVNAVIAAGGGILYIPFGTYQISGSISISGNPNGSMVITGSSGATQLTQNATNSDIFDINAFGNSGGGGLQIAQMTLSYTGNGSGIAMNLSGGTQNVQVTNCVFLNCPSAVFSDNKDLAFGMTYCTIQQDLSAGGSGPGGVAQVTLKGAQQYIDHCVFRQKPISNGGPRNNVCIWIEGAAALRVTNTQISDFDYGMYITGPSQFIWVTSTQLESYTTALTIQPTNSSGQIYGCWFTDCKIMRTNSSNVQSPGVYVDTNGGANSNVQCIFFVNPLAFQWNNSAFQFNAGSQIYIKGGKISSNGLSASSTALSAGVALTGAVDGVFLDNVDLSGIFNFLGSSGVTQPYALAFTGGCTDVWVRNCDVTGNGSGVVYASGQGTHCFIKHCRGYNNLSTVITTTFSPGLGVQFDALGYGTINTPWSTPYFGDYTVIWAGGTITGIGISHDRSTLSQTVIAGYGTGQGSISLNAQQSMQINGSVAPTAFAIIGT